MRPGGPLRWLVPLLALGACTPCDEVGPPRADDSLGDRRSRAKEIVQEFAGWLDGVSICAGDVVGVEEPDDDDYLGAYSAKERQIEVVHGAPDWEGVLLHELCHATAHAVPLGRVAEGLAPDAIEGVTRRTRRGRIQESYVEGCIWGPNGAALRRWVDADCPAEGFVDRPAVAEEHVFDAGAVPLVEGDWSAGWQEVKTVGIRLLPESAAGVVRHARHRDGFRVWLDDGTREISRDVGVDEFKPYGAAGSRRPRLEHLGLGGYTPVSWGQDTTGGTWAVLRTRRSGWRSGDSRVVVRLHHDRVEVVETGCKAGWNAFFQTEAGLVHLRVRETAIDVRLWPFPPADPAGSDG